MPESKKQPAQELQQAQESTAPASPQPPAEEFFKMSEAAERTGLTPRAIRYYEEKGLLEPAQRTEGSYRLFDAFDLERLNRIRLLREVVGLSLEEIRHLVEADTLRRRLRTDFAASDDPATRRTLMSQAIEIVERRLSTLDEKIDGLQQLREEDSARLERLRKRLQTLEEGT